MKAAEATSVPAACAHCGLPVPAVSITPGAGALFCCAGCASVHEILRAAGLDRYYALRAASRDAGRPARVSGASFDEMDDPDYRARACADRPDGALEVEWVLEGVHCAACVWLVERLPRLAEGVLDARLDLAKRRVRVLWDPSSTSLARVARELDRLGYRPHPFRGGRAAEMRLLEDRRMLVRLGVTGAAAANVMAIAFALYGGLLHGMEPEYAALFRWASLIIAIPAVVVGGGVFFRGAIAALRAGRLHMDVPVALGIAAGLAHGAVATIRGRGDVYFDSVTALVFLLLAGRFIQQRQQRAAGDAAEVLAALTPRVARLVEGESTRDVPAESLAPGMIVEVRSGETIPVDGRIVAGRSRLDLSLLTGESRPSAVAPGDDVHAGTVNLGALLRVLAQSTGEATRVGRLTRLVEDHARRRPPVVLLADRIAGVFVGAVLVLAAITALVWWRIEPARAFDATIALLVVSCPCALGLATPLAFSAAIGQAARAGVLIKGGDALERLARPGRLWLDKTGTITEGRLGVVAWTGDASLTGDVAALERESAHPVAQALADRDPTDPHTPASDVVETAGLGIEGTVGRRRLLVGAPAWLVERCGPFPPEVAEHLRVWAARGLTPVGIAVDGRPAAAAALGDRVRPDAADALARIRRLGWTIGILSGDHASVVRSIADRLGIAPTEARGAVSPEAKVDVVVRERAVRPTVMVGDGVNDAAALAAATVGVGVHGGAEAALEAADVYVSRPGVGAVADLLEGSRRAMSVVRRNLVFSIVYNAVGVALAMAGWINPLLAAVLMPASSLTVIVSSYRSRVFEPPGGSACR